MRWVLLKYTVSLLLVLGSGYALMRVSYDVQELERDIVRYEHDISREEEAIRVLNAEWAYLNNPMRLEELAHGYMELVSPEASQLRSDARALSPENAHPSLPIVPIPARSPLYIDISSSSSVTDGGAQ
ncbi:MAG: cell division protein FtsL [Alphaproteobacteria bacterium]